MIIVIYLNTNDYVNKQKLNLKKYKYENMNNLNNNTIFEQEYEQTSEQDSEQELINKKLKQEIINEQREQELINKNLEQELINKKLEQELINKNLEQELINKKLEKELIAKKYQMEIINKNNNFYDQEEYERRMFLRKRDQDVLYNDFAPPERRVNIQSYPYNYVKNNFNIATRGYPDSFQLMGIVLRNNGETVYNLFGRQTFPGSSQYEYYIQSTLNNNLAKIPISIKGDKEIDDGQHINIPGHNGKFNVKLYKYDQPRYNPYLF